MDTQRNKEGLAYQTVPNGAQYKLETDTRNQNIRNIDK